MKVIFKILVLCLYVKAVYVTGRHWVDAGEISIKGFFLLLAGFVAVTYQCILFLHSRNMIGKPTRNNLLLLLGTVLVMLCITELGLRGFAKSLQCSSERGGADYYKSPYMFYMAKCDSCGGRYEYVNGPGHKTIYRTNEFSFPHNYNGYGLRDHEFATKKDTNEFRILALGDSFTEGVGTSADSTWVKQLEAKLNSQPGPKHYTTMNAGVYGSDLFFSYELLYRCLLNFKPDLVILNLNSTDNGEVMMRGDFERFDTNGEIKRKTGPWWEFMFGSSYIVRLVARNLFRYNWQLWTPAECIESDRIGIQKISEKLSDYYTLAQNNNFKFLLILQPLQGELPDGKNFIKRLNIPPAVDRIDLTPYFNQKINVEHQPQNSYYWPVDGHFKSKGYGLEADIIYNRWFLRHDSICGI